MTVIANLEARQELTVKLGDRVTTTPTSLDLGLETALPVAEWSEIGRKLGRVGNAALWWIADWMSAGEKAYGSTYEEAEAITGFAYQTVANVTRVGRAVETSRRREDLSFSHHAEVAALDGEAQDTWLERAAAEGLSVMQLREQIRGQRQLPPASPPPIVTLKFAVPPERAQRWDEAAHDEGLEFDEWATKVLDEASSVG